MDDPILTPPTAAAAERPLQPPARPAEPPISTGKGVKETVESILIAFILAFVFRAFVVEAFVIPTGSMATTLLGAHMRFTCKECGYTFDTNYPSRSTSNAEEIEIPSGRAGRDFNVTCPNCRYEFSETNPLVRYGDRILVLKYLYIPWVSPDGPSRWDVVVFKNPTDPNYSVNYIKRLTGRPGEWVMVLDGDIYICDDPMYAEVAREDAIRRIPPEAWKIQAKPQYAQDALWRIIYDHDYRPIDDPNRTDGWTLPWVPESNRSGWHTGVDEAATPVERASRTFMFNNHASGGELIFRALDIPSGRGPKPLGGFFTDWLGYNVTMQGLEARYPVYTVSDLKLAFTYERKWGGGPLTARLTKYSHEFLLRFEPGKVSLEHKDPMDPNTTKLIAPVRPIKPSTLSGPVRVEFENADYRVRVRLNGELAFETTPGEYHPDVKRLLENFEQRMNAPAPQVTIDAREQEAALTHVSLWRDVYYTPEGSRLSRDRMNGSPHNPMKLGPDEFFVMGDNSAGSYDARFWEDDSRINLPDENLHVEPGRVPRRFLLGRAFFVYWPAGYRPLGTAPALVPNFGEMRLIQ
jgi:signal peptidase I